jgi:hypothetical protein
MAVSWVLVLSLGLWGSEAAAPVGGAVVDAATGAPVAEARVELRRAALEARTDSAGAFSFGSYDVELDTLVVSHPEYSQVRVLVGDLPQRELRLRVALRRNRSEVPDTAAAGAMLRDAQLLAERYGGHVWERQDFLLHAGEVQSPLELLLYSGFVERVEAFGGGWCVELPGAEGCAAVWVDGEPGGMGRLRDRFPSEVGVFVIVPASRAPTGLSGAEDRGLVVLYLFGREP